MSDPTLCPCGVPEFPAVIANPAGMTHVHYRPADFAAFREALLRPLPGEESLTLWNPNQHGDLLSQIMEWWAYVGDVLAVYGERSMNENLLRTSQLDEDVRRIVGILGYRPRPAIAGSAQVAALLSGKRPLLLAPGFAIDSKPAPGKQPQTFETLDPATLHQPDLVPANPPGLLKDASQNLYIQGKVTTIASGDFMVLAPSNAGISTGIAFQVKSTIAGKDAAGNPYTQIIPQGSQAFPAASADGYRLLRANRKSGLWKYPMSAHNLINTPADMEGVERSVKAGDAILFTVPSSLGLAPALRLVSGTEESIWFANGDASTPDPSLGPPVGLPHSRFHYSPAIASVDTWDNNASQVTVHMDWQSAGSLRNTPVATWNGTPMELDADPGFQFQIVASQPALIEDTDGNGALVTATVAASSPNKLQIISFATLPAPTLKTPLKVMQNVISLTQGKTVSKEVLGSGDATLSGQKFVLKKSPLTYLPDGDGYKSTLNVYVNGILWREVINFYGQPPDANVYTLCEDSDNKTTVAF